MFSQWKRSGERQQVWSDFLHFWPQCRCRSLFTFKRMQSSTAVFWCVLQYTLHAVCTRVCTRVCVLVQSAPYAFTAWYSGAEYSEFPLYNCRRLPPIQFARARVEWLSGLQRLQATSMLNLYAEPLCWLRTFDFGLVPNFFLLHQTRPAQFWGR